MIKRKYHSTIASLLLGCMLIMSVPFHNFLHQHIHAHKGSITDVSKQKQLVNVDNSIDFHNCIACTIHQVAHSFFVKGQDFYLFTLSAVSSFIEKDVVTVCHFLLQSPGRAPPIIS
ncbi:hypothetical protein [Balneicella halophila]|uniref:hypothetical protein n=1 Tax=Balneicella halophila TaxID=1537566 RepID=UPI000E3048A6|nr:hypothetical protein [Balneicella halophila]